MKNCFIYITGRTLKKIKSCIIKKVWFTTITVNNTVNHLKMFLIKNAYFTLCHHPHSRLIGRDFSSTFFLNDLKSSPSKVCLEEIDVNDRPPIVFVLPKFCCFSSRIFFVRNKEFIYLCNTIQNCFGISRVGF